MSTILHVFATNYKINGWLVQKARDRTVKELSRITYSFRNDEGLHIARCIVSHSDAMFYAGQEFDRVEFHDEPSPDAKVYLLSLVRKPLL